jgi:TPR repeat protein
MQRCYAILLRAALAAWVIVAAIAGSAIAGPYEDGIAAYDKGDYATALRFVRPLADQGRAAAQLKLGVMYAKGEAVPQDEVESVKWIRLAARQGNAEAQDALGIRYAERDGVVPQDYFRAYMWFDLSAAQGNRSAAGDRDKVAGQMTPGQIAAAQDMAHEWKPAPPQDGSGNCLGPDGIFQGVLHVAHRRLPTGQPMSAYILRLTRPSCILDDEETMHLDQHELQVMPQTTAKFSPLIGKSLSIKGEAPFAANTVYHFRELVMAKAEALPRGRGR